MNPYRGVKTPIQGHTCTNSTAELQIQGLDKAYDLTIAHQALPSMGFSRQAYWSGLPFPSPGDLPNPGIKPGSPTLWADALLSEPPGDLKGVLPPHQGIKPRSPT